MSQDLFVGSWRLLSCELRLDGGKVVYPMGEDCLGSLIYDQFDGFAGHLMKSNRRLFESGNIFDGTPEELKEAYTGYVAYFGTYEVDESRKLITHSPEGSLYPNWIGTKQERIYEFHGDDELTLSTPPMEIGGAMGISALRWARIVA